MLRGWLVVNHFLQTVNFTRLYDRFEQSASALGIPLAVKTNVEAASELVADLGADLPDFVLFWDKDVRLCQKLERLGIRVFNSSRAIEVCDDKTYTYEVLAARGGIAQPESIVVPKAFEAQQWSETPFVDAAIDALGLPLVAKEAFGSFGAQVHLARSRQDVVAFLDETAPEPCLLQRFMAASAGSDVRLQMVGGKFIGAMRRQAKDGDFRANVVNGGTAERYEPTDEEIGLANKACEAIGLDFAGVDLLRDEEGLPCVCEVNSNAHFATIERLNGVDVASAILGHIADSLG